MPDTRLIERWLPIAALGEESVRERRSMTALPPTYYLHVWWARRPLVASRAAVLASLLPADADREKFLHVLGIHGDPVAARKKLIAIATRMDRRLRADNPTDYSRAFGYCPSNGIEFGMARLHARSAHRRIWQFARSDRRWWKYSIRGYPSGALKTLANDLNPVAALIIKGHDGVACEISPEKAGNPSSPLDTNGVISSKNP